MEIIPITDKLLDFKRHLNSNERVILSAGFGSGKTFFLDEFEKVFKDDYLIITVRPVNYIVAENRDIFEYFKRDILFQLSNLASGNTNWWNPKIWKEFPKILAQDMAELAGILKLPGGVDTVEKLKGIVQKVRDHMESQDQVKQISNYIRLFSENKGGLYEEDDITKLIRFLLDSCKKDTVLVVEDMDRLDPAHSFRLMNILAVHVDSKLYKNEESRNKFGFDHIVLVMDFDETKNLFKHFYGSEACFKGYMSKFLTSYPYRYSIQDMAIKKVYDYIENDCGICESDSLLKGFLKGFFEGEQDLADFLKSCSVREILNSLEKVDQQYLKPVINVRGNLILSTEVGIVKMLSLLKLLGLELNYDRLVTALINIDELYVLNLLNCFVLANPALEEEYPIKVGNEIYYFLNREVVLNDDRVIQKIPFRRSEDIIDAQRYLKGSFSKNNFVESVKFGLKEALNCIYDVDSN